MQDEAPAGSQGRLPRVDAQADEFARDGSQRSGAAVGDGLRAITVVDRGKVSGVENAPRDEVGANLDNENQIIGGEVASEADREVLAQGPGTIVEDLTRSRLQVAGGEGGCGDPQGAVIISANHLVLMRSRTRNEAASSRE